jgi:hypothetical protein
MYPNFMKLVMAFSMLMLLNGCQTRATDSLTELSVQTANTLNATGLATQNPVSSTPTPTQTETLLPASTPKQESIPTYTSTPIPIVENLPLPDLLLEVSGGGDEFCMLKDMDEIWFLTSHGTYQPLLSSPDVNYHFPAWSPDGEWIAFVESRPAIVFEDDLPSAVITGTDTIWIMHPDGSELRAVGESLPNALMSHPMGIGLGCDVWAQIDFSPRWSPNGIYLAYVHSTNMSTLFSYYLTDVKSGITSLILTTHSDPSDFIWLPSGNQFLLESPDEAGTFKQVTIRAMDKIEVETISHALPKELEESQRHFFEATDNDNILRGYFFSDGTNISPTAKQSSIWELNIATGEWKQLIELQKEIWYGSQIGSRWGLWYIHKTNIMIIFDKANWDEIGKLVLPSDMEIHGNLQELETYGPDWRIFQASTSTVQDGIWAIRLEPGIAKPVLLWDVAALFAAGADPGKYFTGYTFRPVSP